MVSDNSIYYNDEHILLRKTVREFAQNELAPLAIDIDTKGIFPSESIILIVPSLETSNVLSCEPYSSAF